MRFTLGLLTGFLAGAFFVVCSILIVAVMEEATEQGKIVRDSTYIPPNWQKLYVKERWRLSGRQRWRKLLHV